MTPNGPSAPSFSGPARVRVTNDVGYTRPFRYSYTLAVFSDLKSGICFINKATFLALNRSYGQGTEIALIYFVCEYPHVNLASCAPYSMPVSVE